MIEFASALPDLEIPDVAVTDYVLQRAGDVPDRIALLDGLTGRGYTYSELSRLIAAFAGGLQARGLGVGSTIALMAPNIPEYAIVFHGAARAGVAVSTINPTYTEAEVRFQLQDSGATMLVTVSAFAEVAAAATRDTSVTTIVMLDEATEGALALAEVLGEPISQVDVDTREHVVVLPYSSGTTGYPKGVMLTHRNLVANLVQIEPGLVPEDHEVVLAVLPFFHIYGMQVLMNGFLAQGATIITMPRFDLPQALGIIQDKHVTRFFVVPPIVLALAKHPLIADFDLSSLTQVFSGAAPLSAELAQEASARIDCPVVQGYGMTELSPVTHLTYPGQFRPGSVGMAVSTTSCRIVDPDTGADVGLGEPGELWVRGPQVMKGYLNNPEATAATIDVDGWLHTGDVAVVDELGHFTIVDRVKELIKYKGFQVAPAELEALLLTHAGIADAAVIGVADVEAGEIPRAFVVLTPGHDLSAADITTFMSGQVATYKVIHDVVFVDEVPKSASGKILRRLLRDSAS
ncbi:MAG: AMP-binding protein [Candidatus Nanopelagicales bacterium]